MKNYSLLMAVFVAGFCLMVFEISGSRLIGPFFGTSIYVWTNVIGLILASLSLGYWIGGKRADKHCDTQSFGKLFFGAALSLCGVLLLKDVALAYTSYYIPDIIYGAFISGIALFVLPSFFFGMVSPYAIKLSLKSTDQTGRVAGKLYAVSTIGSIVGTFLAGFVLVPFLGVWWVLVICILMLSLVGVFFTIGTSWKPVAIVTVIITAMVILSYRKARGEVYQSVYSEIRLYESFTKKGSEILVMQIDNHIGSAIYKDSEDLVYPYLQQFRLDKVLNPGFKKGLLIGGAACSYPKELLERYPDVEIDVVEIDEKLIELAHERFRLPFSERLRTFSEDGRTYLNANQEQYDVVYLDAFNSLFSIPYQLCTEEAFKEIQRALNPGGIVLINVLGNQNSDQNVFARSVLRTVNKVFKEVDVIRVEPDREDGEVQNYCLVASDSPLELNGIKKVGQAVEWTYANTYLLSDNKAPVSYLVKELL